jgi:hypothetical protein
LQAPQSQMFHKKRARKEQREAAKVEAGIFSAQATLDHWA